MDAGSVVDGRYEVCRPLSVASGMGDVYLCLDRKLNRQVAVKLIKSEHSSKPEFRERFQREIDSAIALEGYDVVRIHDSGECASRRAPYYVMEYLRGRDMRAELSACGPLEVPRALEILLDVCRVIGAAHARGIVHRDLKPSNLFLEGAGTRRSVRILDFGIARVLGDSRDGALTQLGGQPGSPNYMSPEQHKNELQVGIQADIWALGAVLYEMVVGEKAWPGESYEARQRVLEGATPSVRTSRPELPRELDRIIQKCLEKQPAARYSSIRELERDLGSLRVTHQSANETSPTFVTTVQKRTGRSGYRSRWVWVFGALSVLVAALIGARSWHPEAMSEEPDDTKPSTPTEARGNEAASQPLTDARHTEPSSATKPASLAGTGHVGSTSSPADVLSPTTDTPAKKAARMRRAIPAASASTPPLTTQVPLLTAPKLPRNETRLKTK